jgi:SAM-dependent methyltransferase
MWDYDLWPSRDGDWGDACRGTNQYDLIDFHVDIGCGRVPKGRIGVDRYAAPGVAVIAELDHRLGPWVHATAERPGEDARDFGWDPRDVDEFYGSDFGLPFADSSIRSIISHHCFEHIGEGFMSLVEECHRVLVPGGILRAITPLFPSTAAVEDPDHCRYFMAHAEGGGTWDAFCGTPGDTPQNCWMASFSVPYSTARFEKVDQELTARITDVSQWWGIHDQRELRVALRAMK